MTVHHRCCICASHCSKCAEEIIYIFRRHTVNLPTYLLMLVYSPQSQANVGPGLQLMSHHIAPASTHIKNDKNTANTIYTGM